MALGIDHGGWCPAGRRAEDGQVPKQYQMTELASNLYPERTEKNVRDSDATLILYRGRVTGGTRLTQRICREIGKPSLSVSITYPEAAAERISRSLNDVRPVILNVAGPRESNAVGIQAETCEMLRAVLTG
jgi:hypothetical protein